jgi:hypothetical protein
MLSALRGVLRATWQLGRMTAEDYHRAVDLKGVKGSTVAAGEPRRRTGGASTACANDGTPAGAGRGGHRGVRRRSETR